MHRAQRSRHIRPISAASRWPTPCSRISADRVLPVTKSSKKTTRRRAVNAVTCTMLGWLYRTKTRASRRIIWYASSPSPTGSKHFSRHLAFRWDPLAVDLAESPCPTRASKRSRPGSRPCHGSAGRVDSSSGSVGSSSMRGKKLLSSPRTNGGRSRVLRKRQKSESINGNLATSNCQFWNPIVCPLLIRWQAIPDFDLRSY